MTTKQRIEKLEQAHAAQGNNGVRRVFLYDEDEDMGHLGGVPMSCAEWDKIKTANDLTIIIQREAEADSEITPAIKDGDE